MRIARPSWWKGESVSYGGLHKWLRENFPKLGRCNFCGSEDRRTEYALIKGFAHGRDRDRYQELCTSCHRTYDQAGVKRGPYKKRGESD